MSERSFGLSPPLALLLLVSAVVGCGAASEHRPTPPLPPLGPARPPGAATPGVRYALPLPSCPLTYEATTLETQTMEGAPRGIPDLGLWTMMKIDATKEDTRMALALSIAAHPIMGKHRPFLLPDDDYAKPLLDTDGQSLREVNGPTQAWSAMGTQGGLVWFFPALPDSGDPGATTIWDIASVDPADVLATETRRGTRAEYPKPFQPHADPAHPREPIRAQVRLERWSEDRGQRVAHLVMNAAYAFDERPDGMNMHVRGEARWRGEYEVLASGRLFSAEVQKDTDLALDPAAGAKTIAQKHAMHATMKLHLVRACDGPTASVLFPVPTLAERALEAYGAVWTAIRKGEKDKALAGFGAALRKKHGDAAIWSALGAYRKERGDEALLAPLLLREEDVEADANGKEVRLKTRGTTPDKSTTNTATPLVLEVAVQEESGRLVVTSMRGDLVIAHGSLLEISATALVVRKGWPPK